MKYRIKHITEYLYSDRVTHCYNLAHVIPRDTLRQKCTNNRISVNPISAAVSKREDYFGNIAYHFEIQRSHKTMIITASSEVVTSPQHAALDMDFGLTCREARQLLASDHSYETLMAREFMLDSPMIKVFPGIIEYAAPLFEDDRPLLSAVNELTRKIFRDFEYSPEATSIATPLVDVFQQRKGVCQDFAHLQIACLRGLGFPAKYVSGYLETLPPPGQEKLVGADASHAWLSVFSPTEGWFEFDPTNDCVAGEQHIITSWGRDFSDVTPLRGVIFGGGDDSNLSVSVDVARI